MIDDTRVDLDFVEISRRLKGLDLPPVDLVVGIGSGGVVPAALVAFQLERPLQILTINYRDPNNNPRYPAPVLLAEAAVEGAGRSILLVDDVSVSGRTLALASELLSGHQLTTLVMKGTADFVLFPEVASCVRWPWKGEGIAP